MPPDIRQALWMKFLFITPWSGLGAVTRAPVGIWRSLPEPRQLAEQALHEIVAVAWAKGIALPDEGVRHRFAPALRGAHYKVFDLIDVGADLCVRPGQCMPMQTSDAHPPDDAVQTTLALYNRLPAVGIASMQRDVIEGRPSELDAQVGAVVRLGQAAGVATALHTFLYHSLLPSELRARGQVTFPE